MRHWKPICACTVFIALLIAGANYQAANAQRAGAENAKKKRFIDHGDYVEDTKTGLLWQKDGDDSKKLNYYQAVTYASKQRIGRLDGWRLPTRKECEAIFPATDPPFTDTKYTDFPCCKGNHEWNSYWTGELDVRLPDYAYVYQWYHKGGANNCYASKNYVYVRCVHDPVKR